MKIGWNGTGLVQKASIKAVAAEISEVSTSGYTSYWLADHPTGGFDALTALAVAGQQSDPLELGTAIVPSMPRHPMALAAQALTTAQALHNRLTLGIGLSHATMMADLGINFDKPIRHLREYLSILIPLLEDGEVDFTGEQLSCKAQVFRPAAANCDVLVAALGPQALAVAGRLTSGTTLAWVGPKTIAEHIVPRISEAAAAAGRDAPRIVATLPVCVTADPSGVRAHLSKTLGSYGELPSYRAMFAREGAGGPEDVALIGAATQVEDQVQQLAAAGTTDFCPTIYALTREDQLATRAVLAALANSANALSHGHQALCAGSG
jgi:F420-dependent oxidoreductase-like protein